MRRRGILYLINRLHSSIYRCIETDGIFRTGDIQVDGTGKSDGIDTVSGKRLGTTIGTVTPDNHNAVNAMLPTDFSTLLLAFLGLELQTSCRTENGTASLNNIGNTARFHIYDFFIQKSLISLFYTLNLYPSCECSTNNRTDCSIHSGCIATAGQNTDCFDFFRHIYPPLLP